MSTGSESLYIATNQNAYIASVNILIPSSWSGIENVVSSEDYAFTVGLIQQVLDI